MRIIGYMLVIFLFTAQVFGQARKPMTISELVTYNGKDREQVLYAGAKNEGKVTGTLRWPAIRTKAWSSLSKRHIPA